MSAEARVAITLRWRDVDTLAGEGRSVLGAATAPG